MKVLLLGGTADARKILRELDALGLLQVSDQHPDGIQMIYSIAGLVRTPDVPCEVISGGFSQYGGLRHYLEENGIDAILDATHPFAQTMSNTAVRVAKECQIPCIRFHRPAWEAQATDQWQSFDDWQALIPELAGKQSVLLTAGQLDQTTLDQLVDQANAQQPRQTLILRTAAKPRVSLPDSIIWLKALGPFKETDELALMQEHKIDALVSKNSGGAATQAKLFAARTLGVQVLMLQRPEFDPADKQFSRISDCIDWLTSTVKQSVKQQNNEH